MLNPESRRSIGHALALMTAWLECPDGPPDLLVDCLDRQLGGDPSRDALENAVEVIMGLANFCGSLLALRELETGIVGRQTVQDLALEFHQD